MDGSSDARDMSTTPVLFTRRVWMGGPSTPFLKLLLVCFNNFVEHLNTLKFKIHFCIKVSICYKI